MIGDRYESMKQTEMLQKSILLLLILFLSIFSHAKSGKKSEDLISTNKNYNIKIGSVVALGALSAGIYFEYSQNTESWYNNKYAFQEMVFEKIPNYETVVDDFTQFAPLGVAAGMIVLDPLGKSKIGEQFVRLATAELIGVSAMGILKKATKRRRPDGSKMNSFPSGHTTQAFIAARFLDKEFKDEYPWLVYTGYVLASFTGASRILNNRHWISDVLVGTGLGILSVDLTYLLFDKFKNKNIVMSPTLFKKGAGIYFAMKF